MSGASGCRYCQAHAAHGAAIIAGADEVKVAAVWEFETSDLFCPAERAALNLALAAGQTSTGMNPGNCYAEACYCWMLFAAFFVGAI